MGVAKEDDKNSYKDKASKSGVLEERGGRVTGEELTSWVTSVFDSLRIQRAEEEPLDFATGRSSTPNFIPWDWE